jgi:phosphorylase/glycogen(starch) synthase
MPEEIQLKPDYIFEVSWEVCNKVGGIHTVVATKAKTLKKDYGDRLIMIGPNVWKGTEENPEFTENKFLFKTWREHAANEGLKVKIGKWNIPSSPIAILVDFSPLYIKKDEIFTDLWVKYRLDSLTGAWDYIEPALFGYAAGQVIDCFYRYHLNSTDKIIAQFHEWMTGGGILFLKDKAPQVATVFTTHATVLGRCIAGNGLPFYGNFENYNPDTVAKDFNVIAKHSLEKTAAKNADCFTTVSEITTRECIKFLDKKPDFITHNGFDISIVPDLSSFDNKRKEAREKLFRVAEALMGEKFDRNSLLIIKSGRYEFKNKGLDLFIDSIANIKNNAALPVKVIAFIFVPAHQTGPRKELLNRMEHPAEQKPIAGEILTHNLQGIGTDPIMQRIITDKLNNLPGDGVNIIFSPTYLDGKDGVFNLSYYDILIGFDLAIFPSYYEPWGYTPLESMAFHIPGITTSVSGFGTVISNILNHPVDAIQIVNRTDDNDKAVVNAISNYIIEFSKKTEEEIKEIRSEAATLSKMFSWSNLVKHYFSAYAFAIQNSLARKDMFRYKPQAEPAIISDFVPENKPVWRNISIQFDLPNVLSALKKLSKNLWMSWNYQAEELFEYIDRYKWELYKHNPLSLLQSLSLERIKELANDKPFLKELNTVEKQFDKYMSSSTGSKQPLIAYFCMEYGLTSYIKLYSGGLGILAGDYLKEASDQGVNMIGIGLLYKYGYFKQIFSIHGDQMVEYDAQNFMDMPLQAVNNPNGERLILSLTLPGRIVHAHVWKLDVGKAPLYLLDTDLKANSPEDRNITSRLYDGDIENRLRQEMLLGIGGIRVLNALGIHPDVYHCNEGHAAFISLERLDTLIQKENLSFDEATEVITSSTLFTTHTSVPAANDRFTEEQLRPYLAHKAQNFNIDWEVLMGYGRINPNDHNEKFSMTYFASKLSKEINAVSKIHKNVSEHILNPLWNDLQASELDITSVTNGVHFSTWTAKQWQDLFKKIYGSFPKDSSASKAILDVPAQEIWDIRKTLKRKLLDYLKIRFATGISLNKGPKKLLNLINILDEDILLIGFARRFVMYKRPELIFYDLERLSRIINNSEKPVQFLFAGKPHPSDQVSVNMVKNILGIASRPEFEKNIIFLEDYDIELAKHLVQGVDIWLNTPVRGMEASGTSGMKAALNGVLNFSVLDGWWAEAYKENGGWALSSQVIYEQPDFQDQYDAETIYTILENEIVPLYYQKDDQGVPEGWVNRIKRSISDVLPEFTTTRMIHEYTQNYYDKLSKEVKSLSSENFSLAKQLAAWKKKILKHWKEVDVISIDIEKGEENNIVLGEEFYAKIVLDLGLLDAEDIGVEIIFVIKSQFHTHIQEDIFLRTELSLVDAQDGEGVFVCKIPLTHTGNYDYSFRVFPKNPLIEYKREFCLAKWV